jgi:hypothetical protein
MSSEQQILTFEAIRGSGDADISDQQSTIDNLFVHS